MKDKSQNNQTWYMIVFNKEQDNQHRTRFMTYPEALEMVIFALEKKKFRVSSV
jgi:hypothetical protein